MDAELVGCRRAMRQLEAQNRALQVAAAQERHFEGAAAPASTLNPTKQQQQQLIVSPIDSVIKVCAIYLSIGAHAWALVVPHAASHRGRSAIGSFFFFFCNVHSP